MFRDTGWIRWGQSRTIRARSPRADGELVVDVVHRTEGTFADFEGYRGNQVATWSGTTARSASIRRRAMGRTADGPVAVLDTTHRYAAADATDARHDDPLPILRGADEGALPERAVVDCVPAETLTDQDRDVFR